MRGQSSDERYQNHRAVREDLGPHHADETNAYIEISDIGTGIAPELLPRVFDLFVQSERTLD
jgi:signal transduction histidine kinase